MNPKPDLSSMTLAELADLMHDVIEEVMRRYQEVLALLADSE